MNRKRIDELMDIIGDEIEATIKEDLTYNGDVVLDLCKSLAVLEDINDHDR